MYDNGMTIDLHYKAISIRVSEETKKQLIERRKKSGKSWNLFIVELLKKK